MKNKIETIKSYLGLNITLLIFFPIIIDALYFNIESSKKTEVVIGFSVAISFLIFFYLLFNYKSEKLKNIQLSYFIWILNTSLISFSLFLFFLVFLGEHNFTVNNNLEALFLMSSLRLILYLPVILFVLLFSFLLLFKKTNIFLISKKHEEFMKRAIELSRESVLSGGGPFGAVVVKDGKIVGEGMNRVTVHNDPTAHGEIVAIRNACQNLKSFQLEGCIIYTSTEPCPMCLGAIYWARPEAVYYGNTKEDAANIDFDDHFIYQELDKTMENRKIPFLQIMREQALEVFKEWKEKNDKIEY